MKTKIWMGIFTAMAFTSCNHCCQDGGGSGVDSARIPVDSANKMIGSYLGSINYQQNDSDIRSISFDAEALRQYLNCTKGSKDITSMKIMFAHNLDYINSGHQNQFAGYKTGKLTLVIAAYDAKGNYIYLPGNFIIDHGVSCPNSCPVGAAASPFLQTTNAQR